MKQIFRRISWNLPNRKERRVLTIILPLVDPNGFVKKLTLFLPGLAPLQSLRTKFSVAWLEIFRPGTRHHRIWGTSTTFPLKTSQPCDEIQEDLQICTSPDQHQWLDHNCHQVSAESRSKKMKESMTMTNLTPRINRISSIALIELTPNIASLLSLLGTHSTLCVLDVVCCCLVCFLSLCVVTLCLCLFCPLGFKTPLACRTPNRKPL
jgi:hypothetical protein